MDLAEETARNAHANQKYGDGGPYADAHLRAVVAVLADFGFDDAKWVAAGWLHDVVEDTPLTVAAVGEAFGPEGADLVWAVTGEGADRKERAKEHLPENRRFAGSGDPQTGRSDRQCRSLGGNEVFGHVQGQTAGV